MQSLTILQQDVSQEDEGEGSDVEYQIRMIEDAGVPCGRGVVNRLSSGVGMSVGAAFSDLVVRLFIYLSLRFAILISFHFFLWVCRKRGKGLPRARLSDAEEPTVGRPFGVVLGLASGHVFFERKHNSWRLI